MGALEKLADTVPAPDTSSGQKFSQFNLGDWIMGHELKVAFQGPWGEGGTKWILDQCPWNPDHTNRSAYIVQLRSGAIAARCKHNGCAGKEWKDLKSLYEPQRPPSHYKNGAINSDAYDDLLESPTAPKTTEPKVPLIELMDTIEREYVDFLWKNRIPRGKLTDFSGDPGVGKSTAASMIAAMASVGKAFPFDREPENVLKTIIISSEDTPADVLRPRLEKMGADLSMIAIPHRQRTPSPSSVDVNFIDQMLTHFPAALCIIDPIIAYTTGKDTNKAADVRSFLGPLTSIAEKHKTAIIIIRHLNKNSGNSAMYRGQGSIDFSATCRSGFIFTKDHDNPDRRLMSHYKSSLAKTQPTLEYFIDDDGSFRWGAESSETADDAVAPQKERDRESAKKNEAKALLEKILEFGARDSADIKKKFEQAGMSSATLWRAKRDLDIKATQDRQTGGWLWRLPS